MDANIFLMRYFLVFALISPTITPTGRASNFTGNYTQGTRIIGAILDCSSRVGKEERVAMEMAVEDLNKLQKNQKLILLVKCSRGEPVLAAQAARHLINKNHVQVILGPNSWEESSAVAEVVGQQLNNIPIISLSDSTPPWATAHWPFFIQASPNTSNQMKAVAAITKSWEWHRVNFIYDDSSSDILNHLYEAFYDVDIQINALVPLPSFVSPGSLQDELHKLKQGPCRVFVVHAGLALAERIFQKAKEMMMVEKDYVWIVTDPMASMLHYTNASVVSSMQGVVGVRRYFPDVGSDFRDFYIKFVESFRHKYAGEKNHDPGLLALQAYDVTLAVGSAINSGEGILEYFEDKNRPGLSGEIQFKDRKLAPESRFQIVNVVGKSSYQELGFWSKGLGFSTVADDHTAVYNLSMEILGHVVWPGRPWSTPRGWELPTVFNPLKIGVPNGSLTNKFVKVEFDPDTNNYNFSGFSIEVFKKAVLTLNYLLPYEFIPFNGKYTDLVKQVQLKEFDAAVGDIAIISNRYDYVEFTHAHTESGVVMVVPVESHPNRVWLFLKPFTKAMWLLTGFINVYNGFVIWSIERNYCSELRGSLLNQIGTLLWLAFATLFSLHGERLHSNLSKMATIVWLFVALIITQSYTASLASMLTVSKIEPKYKNVETLKSVNAYIGCSQRSFVKAYLVEALRFNDNNIKNFTTPEAYAAALRSGEISAAFLESPVAKLFVAKYCKSFTIAGPTFKVGGYGYAFPKGSLLLPDMDEALLTVFESGTFKDLETTLIASEKCVDIQPDNETASLSPQSFFVLFIFTGTTSTTVLAVYYFRRKRELRDESNMGQHKRIWMLIAIILNKWRYQRFSRKVSDLESPTNFQDASSPYGHA